MQFYTLYNTICKQKKKTQITITCAMQYCIFFPVKTIVVKVVLVQQRKKETNGERGKGQT